MSIDLEIQRLLRTHTVKEINFSADSRRVTGQGFYEVSTHLSDRPMPRRIRVSVNPTHVGRRSVAEYWSWIDAIMLRSDRVLDTPFGRSTVVHECAHAQFDLRGIDTRMRLEEGAAFVAHTWYLLATGELEAVLPIYRIPPGIITVAAAVRQRSLSNNGRLETLTTTEVQTIRAAAASLRIRTGWYHADGINRRIYRGH